MVQAGMLPVLTELTPSLKQKPNALLTHNVMLNISNYASPVHYAFAHTLLPPGPLSSALLGFDCPWGSLMSSDVVWQHAPAIHSAGGIGSDCAHPHLPLDGVLMPSRVSAWLTALFVRLALPPWRRYDVKVHHYPNTVAAWWRMLELVAQRVPLHWLAPAVQAVADTLAGKPVSAPQVPMDTHHGNTPPNILVRHQSVRCTFAGLQNVLHDLYGRCDACVLLSLALAVQFDGSETHDIPVKRLRCECRPVTGCHTAQWSTGTWLSAAQRQLCWRRCGRIACPHSSHACCMLVVKEYHRTMAASTMMRWS